MKTALLFTLLASTLACASPAPVGPYSADAERSDAPARDTARATALNAEAADCMATDPERAEGLLRDALQADLFFGPAHNNLGILHLEQGELYEAAHEFEWARKLLPGHPDPRLNLAITLHHAGRVDDSSEAYEAALEVSPGYMPALQGLVRLHIQHGVDDERVPGWLRRIVMEGETPRWRAWAAEQLALRTER